MIFDTLASMADDANDRIKNFNSTPQQAKDVLVDVDNEGLKTVIDFATKGGVCNIDNETLTVGGRTIVNNKLNELKHVIVGMQQKHPMKIIQDNQASSSSSSSSTAPYAPSLSCSGGTEPSIALTVTGASGTVSWGGKTWNLPEDSGLSQEVCPTYYYFGNDGNGDYEHKWDGNALSLYRQYSTFGGDSVSHANQVVINAPINLSDHQLWWGKTYNYPSIPNVSYSYIGLYILTGVAFATRNNYAITDAFFGSYTQGGITYTWARGTNW